jgi:hypothetical protein
MEGKKKHFLLHIQKVVLEAQNGGPHLLVLY